MGLEEILFLTGAHSIYWESKAQRSPNNRLKYMSFPFHLFVTFMLSKNSSPQQFIDENLRVFFFFYRNNCY